MLIFSVFWTHHVEKILIMWYFVIVQSQAEETRSVFEADSEQLLHFYDESVDEEYIKKRGTGHAIV